MSGGGLLIDRRGRARPDAPDGIAERLAQGFIQLRRSAGGVRLAMVPGEYTQAGLFGAMLALETAPERIVVSLFKEERWSHEMFADQATLVLYLEGLARDPPTGPRWPWTASRLDLTALGAPALETLQPLLALWEGRRGRLPADLAPLLGTRGIVMRRVRRRWVFETVPTGTVIMRPCEWLTRIGERIEDQPDPGYWAWAAQTYDGVAASGRPRLDLVRATVGAIDGATIRTRYHRLSLPWRSAAGDLHVSVVSIRRGLAVDPPAPLRQAR